MKSRLTLLSSLLLISAIAAQTPAPIRSELCSVAGQIVQQPGAVPVRKAAVMLARASDDPSDSPELHALTDAEGRFKIEDVKPGDYHVYFGREGFVDGEKRHQGSGMLLSLERGQQVKNLLFHMAAAAVIVGKVLDEDGDSMPGAQMWAVPYGTVPHGAARRSPLHSASGCDTNDLGECRISGLAPGRYLVAVQPQFKGSFKDGETYATTYFPGRTDKKLAVPVELRAGDEVPVAVTMALVPTFHVRGQVNPLPEWVEKEPAELMLQSEDGEIDFDRPGVVLDAHGGFDLGGIAPGLYTVWLSPTIARGLAAFSDSQSPQVMGTDQTVRVADADVNDLRIAPLRNGQIRGHLRMDNAEKTDWSQMVLWLRSDSAPPAGMMGGFAEVGAKRDGSFETMALPNLYHLQLSLAGTLPSGYFLKTVTLGGKDVTDSGLNVGGSTLSLDVVVSANAATVDGVINDEQGKPASDVEIICIPEAKRHKRRDLYRLVTTDARGHFSLRGLSPGEYQLFGVDADFDQEEISEPDFVHAHDSLGQTIQLKEGEHKSLQLKLEPFSD